MRFQGKGCIVSGAGSGIGQCTALRLAREGAKVVVADVNEAGGKATVEQARGLEGQVTFVQCDVSNSESVSAAVRNVMQHYGQLDLVVNCAAIMTFKPVVELDVYEWDRVLAVNLRSIFLFAKHALPHMKRGDSIINISSVHAHETTRNVAPYAASKGGMEAFTRSLSQECAEQGVRVNCIAPGAIDTPMLWSNPNIKSGVEKITAPVGKPDDIAEAVCFLASEDARFVTGTTLVVDGGRLSLL